MIQLGRGIRYNQHGGKEDPHKVKSKTTSIAIVKQPKQVDRIYRFYCLCNQPIQEYAGSAMLQCDQCD